MHPPFDEFAWAALIDDLDASALVERDSLVRELGAAHAAELRLKDRLALAVDGPIRVRLPPCHDIEGRLMRVGRDHLWVADAHGCWLLATAEIDGLSGWRAKAFPQERRDAVPVIESRGMASAVRELVGLGRQLSVLVGDRWIAGRLRMVGADFIDIDDVSLPLQRVRACRVWY